MQWVTSSRPVAAPQTRVSLRSARVPLCANRSSEFSKANKRMTRTFWKHIFSKVASLKPDCEPNGGITEFMPQSKYKHKEDSSLHKYGRGPFCRFRITKDLPFQGVYILTENGNIAYIGECEDLSDRINMGYGQISPRNCYEGGQRTNCKINTLIFRATHGDKEIDL